MSDGTTTTDLLSEIAPEPPPKGAVMWMRENLFSSVASSILSVISILLVLAAYRGLLRFAFDSGRRWDAVTANMRLLMVQAYPAGDNPIIADEAGNAISQIHRVWISVGLIVVLIALSLAIYRVGGLVSRGRVGRVLMALGGFVFLGGVLGPFSAGGRLGWLIVGGALLGVGYLLGAGENSKQETIPVLALVGGAIVLVLVVLWTISVPVPLLEGGIVYERVAQTTALPWTVLAIVGVLAYLGGLAFRDRVEEQVLRRYLTIAWIASFPVIVLAILRDPDIDYGNVLSFFLPWAVGIAVVGVVLIAFLGSGRAGEAGRGLAGIILVIAIASFFFSTPFLVRWLLWSLAVFSLAAPIFGGAGAAGRRMQIAWVGWVALLTYLMILITADSTVQVPGQFFFGGLGLTFIIAITSIAASFPLGVVLALGRTSTMPLFRLMSTAYIELIRGVPLITWLLVGFLMLPVALPEGVEIKGVMRAIGAITFFSAAYLAENVRGGLQSIPKGQYEAARALGMGTVQYTIFITMPQALRAVIPALVGQVIALFKDTSLVTIVGLFDFLHIARQIIPAQTQPFNFLGSIKETLIFAAIVYWIFTFTMSRFSLRLEKKLGVGER